MSYVPRTKSSQQYCYELLVELIDQGAHSWGFESDLVVEHDVNATIPHSLFMVMVTTHVSHVTFTLEST